MKATTAMLLLLAVLSATCLLASARGGDDDGAHESEQEFEEDDRKPSERRHSVRTRIDGHSGKIFFTGAGATFNETVRIEIKRITEVTADGDKVDSDHDVGDFENAAFTFDPEVNTTFQGLAVHKIRFSATDLISLDDGSDLFFEIFTFKENGIIQVDGVDTGVQVGSIKWNIGINSWPFCDASDSTGGIHDCDGDEGAFLDFVLKIQTGEEDDAPEKPEDEREFAHEVDDSSDAPRNRRFRLGATTTTVNEDPTLLGPELILSSKVTVDDDLQDQPEGFPDLKSEAGEQRFTFRFPRGDAIYYDPVLSLSGTSSAVTVAANALLVALASLFATFMML